MRKSILLTTIALSSLALSSCTKDNDTLATSVANGQITFAASMYDGDEDGLSKTQFADTSQGTLCFSPSEVCKVFSETGSTATLVGTSTGSNTKLSTSTTFTITMGETAYNNTENFIAYIPASAVSDEQVLTIPSTQNPGGGNYDATAVIAKATAVKGSKTFKFTTQTALLKIKATSNDDISIEAAGICGTGSDSDNKITVTGLESGNTYFISVWPRTYSDGIVIKDATTNTLITTIGAGTLKPGKKYNVVNDVTLELADLNKASYLPSTATSIIFDYNMNKSDLTGYTKTATINTYVNIYKKDNEEEYLVLSPKNIKMSKSLEGMFKDYKLLTTLEFNNFNTSAVTNMKAMFMDCNNLSTIDVSNLNTSIVTNMTSMFQGCSSLTTLDVSSLNSSKAESMNSMFASCSNLTSINLKNLSTESAKTLNSMFNGCSKLQSIDLSGFVTTNVIDLCNMFYKCEALTTLDLSKFETKNVTNFGQMFNGCSSLESVNVSNFNTTSATSMKSMFSGCSSLKSISVSNFNTTKVTDLSAMFNGCSKLTTIDISNFETSESLMYLASMFNNCSNVVTLDISGFTTSGVKEMQRMFYKCSKLTTIYASSNFTTDGVQPNDNDKDGVGIGMFADCTSLVGGNGSKLSSTNNGTNKNYAHIDTSGNPGYFTAKSASK